MSENKVNSEHKTDEDSDLEEGEIVDDEVSISSVTSLESISDWQLRINSDKQHPKHDSGLSLEWRSSKLLSKVVIVNEVNANLQQDHSRNKLHEEIVIYDDSGRRKIKSKFDRTEFQLKNRTQPRVTDSNDCNREAIIVKRKFDVVKEKLTKDRHTESSCGSSSSSSSSNSSTSSSVDSSSCDCLSCSCTTSEENSSNTGSPQTDDNHHRKRKQMRKRQRPAKIKDVPSFRKDKYSNKSKDNKLAIKKKSSSASANIPHSIHDVKSSNARKPVVPLLYRLKELDDLAKVYNPSDKESFTPVPGSIGEILMKKQNSKVQNLSESLDQIVAKEDQEVRTDILPMANDSDSIMRVETVDGSDDDELTLRYKALQSTLMNENSHHSALMQDVDETKTKANQMGENIHEVINRVIPKNDLVDMEISSCSSEENENSTAAESNVGSGFSSCSVTNQKLPSKTVTDAETPFPVEWAYMMPPPPPPDEPDNNLSSVNRWCYDQNLCVQAIESSVKDAMNNSDVDDRRVHDLAVSSYADSEDFCNEETEKNSNLKDLHAEQYKAFMSSYLKKSENTTIDQISSRKENFPFRNEHQLSQDGTQCSPIVTVCDDNNSTNFVEKSISNIGSAERKEKASNRKKHNYSSLIEIPLISEDDPSNNRKNPEENERIVMKMVDGSLNLPPTLATNEEKQTISTEDDEEDEDLLLAQLLIDQATKTQMKKGNPTERKTMVAKRSQGVVFKKRRKILLKLEKEQSKRWAAKNFEPLNKNYLDIGGSSLDPKTRFHDVPLFKDSAKHRFPPVKPVIISLKSDSDSDESEDKTADNSVLQDHANLASGIDKFIKSVRNSNSNIQRQDDFSKAGPSFVSSPLIHSTPPAVHYLSKSKQEKYKSLKHEFYVKNTLLSKRVHEKRKKNLALSSDEGQSESSFKKSELVKTFSSGKILIKDNTEDDDDDVDEEAFLRKTLLKSMMVKKCSEPADTKNTSPEMDTTLKMNDVQHQRLAVDKKTTVSSNSAFTPKNNDAQTEISDSLLSATMNNLGKRIDKPLCSPALSAIIIEERPPLPLLCGKNDLKDSDGPIIPNAPQLIVTERNNVSINPSIEGSNTANSSTETPSQKSPPTNDRKALEILPLRVLSTAQIPMVIQSIDENTETFHSDHTYNSPPKIAREKENALVKPGRIIAKSKVIFPVLQPTHQDVGLSSENMAKKSKSIENNSAKDDKKNLILFKRTKEELAKRRITLRGVSSDFFSLLQRTHIDIKEYQSIFKEISSTKAKLAALERKIVEQVGQIGGKVETVKTFDAKFADADGKVSHWEVVVNELGKQVYGPDYDVIGSFKEKSHYSKEMVDSNIKSLEELTNPILATLKSSSTALLPTKKKVLNTTPSLLPKKLKKRVRKKSNSFKQDEMKFKIDNRTRNTLCEKSYPTSTQSPIKPPPILPSVDKVSNNESPIRRKRALDPEDVDVLCTHDLLGRCNDDSCPYQHLSRPSERNVEKEPPFLRFSESEVTTNTTTTTTTTTTTPELILDKGTPVKVQITPKSSALKREEPSIQDTNSQAPIHDPLIHVESLPRTPVGCAQMRSRSTNVDENETQSSNRIDSKKLKVDENDVGDSYAKTQMRKRSLIDASCKEREEILTKSLINQCRSMVPGFGNVTSQDTPSSSGINVHSLPNLEKGLITAQLKEECSDTHNFAVETSLTHPLDENVSSAVSKFPKTTNSLTPEMNPIVKIERLSSASIRRLSKYPYKVSSSEEAHSSSSSSSTVQPPAPVSKEKTRGVVVATVRSSKRLGLRTLQQ